MIWLVTVTAVLVVSAPATASAASPKVTVCGARREVGRLPVGSDGRWNG